MRQAVLDRILIDKLNLTTVQKVMERDFLLKLSTGFIYDCLEYAVRKFDGNAFRARVLNEFSGTLCVDEIHLGQRVVLLASDPVSDNPVACALVSSNDGAHMQRFLRNLKNQGFSPKTVVTDRSSLYPRALAEIWPQAQHQLCVFHVMAEINGHIFEGVREVRRALRPPRIKRGTGRPSNDIRFRVKKLKARRELLDRLYRRRHLLVTKPANLKPEDHPVLQEFLRLSPRLRVMRAFVEDLHELFAIDGSKEQAWSIWRRMKCESDYVHNEQLRRALAILSEETVRKLLAYLNSPLAIRSKIRTNNHVERCNRVVRYLEKIRYRWRRRRTIVRHLLLQFEIWLKSQGKTPAGAA